MKASFEALSAPEPQTFLVREFDNIGFSAPFHYHPEVELTLITSGEGDRFVGSHMDRFDAGDLIMIGSNVPHCWKLKTDTTPGSCIVIQFMSNFMGDQFFQNPAMNQIGQLLIQCQRGIRLKGNLRDLIETLMNDIVQLSGPFELCIHLLELLQQIATGSARRHTGRSFCNFEFCNKVPEINSFFKLGTLKESFHTAVLLQRTTQSRPIKSIVLNTRPYLPLIEVNSKVELV